MKNKRILFIIISMVLLIFCTVVYAETIDELQERKNELQNSVKEANGQIDSIEIEQTETLKKITELEGQILKYEESLKEIRNELTITENEIKETEEKLEVAQKNYDNQKNVFQNRLVALYETGETSYLDVLLNSKSVSNFVANYYLIGEIAAIDNDLLTTIETEKNEISKIKEELDSKKKTLRYKEENEQKTLTTIKNTKIQRDNYLLTLTEQEQEVRKRIQELESEINSIESQINVITSGLSGGEYTGGLFAWPAPGYKTITSPYGWRIHPTLKTYRLHTGIDIGMPTGANIVAANSGTVIKSEWMGGYGNAVIIDHGGGYSTLYGHGSELVAKVGDKVNRGDVIMKAGSTGWSTGSHLHFEVRINGDAKNPIEYL